MSRKMLITLIVVMAAVLSGLIFVQANMIKSASDIREEQFNRSVENVLLFVSAQLNQFEEREARKNAFQNKLPIEIEMPESFNTFPRNSNVQSSLSFGITVIEHATSRFIKDGYQIEFEGSTNTLSSGDSLVVAQMFIKEQQRRQELWLRNDSWKTHKIILEGRPVKERIDSTFLDNLLKAAIAETEIGIDFKYAIKNANLGKEKVVFGNHDYNPGRSKEFNQHLFRHDFDGLKPYYLNVYFPKRLWYLLK